jgi:hypothetical protein
VGNECGGDHVYLDRPEEAGMSEHWETFKVKGDEVLSRIKQLVHEGNVRRVAIKQGGTTVAEFPLSVGIVGAVGAPALAAIGALAALLTHCSFGVERAEDGKKDQAKSAPRKSAAGTRRKRAPKAS